MTATSRHEPGHTPGPGSGETGARTAPGPHGVGDDEPALLAALRRGDERAYEALVERHHGSLVRLAQVWVRDGAAAEDVAQETWIAVLRGLDGFEGRSRLQSWIFSILVNQAKRRAVRDRRTVVFSALGTDRDDGGWSVDPDRFFPPGHPDAGHWNRPVTVREDDPEHFSLSNEVSGRVLAAIETLPPNYRAVIILRDIEGWSAEEACAILDVTAANQRVLLHRARSKVRETLEPYLRAPDEDAHAS